MKTCSSCGATIDDNTAFCTVCGAPCAPAAPTNYAQPMAAPDQYDHTAEFDPADISQHKVFAILPYLGGMLGIVVASIAVKDSPYLKFHVRQAVGISVINLFILFFTVIPFLGWFACSVCNCILLVVRIIAFAWVCQGKAKEAPIIRSFGFMR